MISALALDHAWGHICYQGLEAARVLGAPGRPRPGSPAYHNVRERDLERCIRSINYHSHRRPA